MKKSSPLVIIIPLIVALLVVGSVVVVKYFSPVPKESKAATEPAPTPAEIPSFSGESGTPSSGFDEVGPSSPVSDLRNELDASADSGDADINLLEEEANSL